MQDMRGSLFIGHEILFYASIKYIVYMTETMWSTMFESRLFMLKEVSITDDPGSPMSTISFFPVWSEDFEPFVSP